MLWAFTLWMTIGAWAQIIPPAPLTQEEVARLEAAVEAQPRQRRNRLLLLQHYLANTPASTLRVRHVLYWIENFPADRIASNPLCAITVDQNVDGHELVRYAWARAVASNPDEPPIPLNAARFLHWDHPEEAGRLLEDAIERLPDSKSLAVGLGFHYATNLLGLRSVGGYSRGGLPTTDKLREDARAALNGSRNPFVLAAAGVALQRMPFTGPTASEARDLGARLLVQARDLAPAQDQFQDAIALVEQDYEEAVAQERVGRFFRFDHRTLSGAPGGVIRISGAVMAGSLVERLDPIYPHAARESGLQGLVRFTVTIGVDGSVRNPKLISGSPLLVEAAKDALRSYRYEPVWMNGRAVPVLTDVVVSFTLQR